MRYNLLLLCGFFFSTSLFSQNQNLFLTSKLKSGCPTEIEAIKKQLGLNDMNYTSLETGLDSVKIIFGQMTQKEVNGYWISIYLNGKLRSFKTVQLDKVNLSKNIRIEFDQSKGISLYLTHNLVQNEINYFWLKNNEKTERLAFENIENPLAYDQQFPDLKLKALNGKCISTNDFKGKTVVINWWATACAPCRKEIPGLNKLVEKFKLDSNIIFLAIAFDKRDWLENYLKQNQFNYFQTLGDKDAAKMFGESFPQHIILNKVGIIKYYSLGGKENKYEDIERELNKIIKN